MKILSEPAILLDFAMNNLYIFIQFKHCLFNRAHEQDNSKLFQTQQF